MAIKFSRQNVKKTFNYIQKVISYACIVILVLLSVFFVVNFIESRIAKSKGESYIPRFSLYTIISPSMTPTINVYDVIFDVKVKDPAKIKKGDVITFVSTSAISKGLTITHRVTKVVKTTSGYEYFTKGDANLFEDGATAKSENLIGKVIFKIPQLGRVQFLVKSKIGWLLCIVLPALIVIIFDIIKLNKTMKLAEQSQAIMADNTPKKLDNEVVKQNIINNAASINLPIKDVNKNEPISKIEANIEPPVNVQPPPVTPPIDKSQNDIKPVININDIDDDDLPKLK